MMHRDFLVRQLQQAVQILMQTLARVMKLRGEEQVQEALNAIDDAFANLEMAPRPVSELSVDEIVEMCRTSRGFEADLLLTIADLLREEGELRELDGDPARARASFEKALALYRAALSVEGAALPLDVGERLTQLEELVDGG